MALAGYRTLCIAERELSTEQYNAWHEQYKAASVALVDREMALARVSERIEMDMTLLGATAVEDKLQVRREGGGRASEQHRSGHDISAGHSGGRQAASDEGAAGKEGKPCTLFSSLCSLPRHVALFGAQEGVPEAIESLIAAGIKVCGSAAQGGRGGGGWRWGAAHGGGAEPREGEGGGGP